MSKKLILFLMVLLFGSTSFMRANKVTDQTPGEWNPDPTVALTTINLMTPTNGAQNVASPVTLTWETDVNAVEYKVEFGTTYPPATLVDWDTITPDNLNFLNVGELDANTRYFWRVSLRNATNSITSPLYNFVTTMTVPTNVELTETEIFEGGSTTVKWKGGSTGGGGFTGELTVADGTSTSSYIPVYGLWMDDYTRGEMIYPAEMLEEMEGGEITSLKYYISSSATGPWSGDVFNVYLMEVNDPTLTAYYTSANATIVYTGSLDGQGTEMNIEFDTPYLYSGGNLLIGIEETVCGTYKSCSFYGITATGASASGYSSSALSAVTFTQRNFLPKTTFTCGGKGGNRSLVGYNVYVDNVKKNETPISAKQYELTGLTYNMTGYAVNVTAVYNEGESGYNQGENIVKVSGAGSLNGTVVELLTGAPMANVAINFHGTDEFGNDANYAATTDANGAYNIDDVYAGVYTMGKAQIAGFEPNFLEAPATVVYGQATTVNFTLHEIYYPVAGVIAEDMDVLAMVKWSMGEISMPNPGTGGGGGTTTYNFDSGMMGWTSLDANNDGYGWVLGTQTGGVYLASGASLSGTGHNSSTDMMCSGSYSNATGAAITPDNFLISPAKGQYSSISFFACAQDASYCAEHYGVAVSTTTATASAFQMVQEWTMTAKDQGAMSVGRDGQTRAQGSWYEKTVDLSAYAGQDIWVAIRHFNCNDQFILNVDDITLTAPAKGDRSVNFYTLYKKTLLKENMVAPDSTVVVDNYTDTAYADISWGNVVPGLYQYGVSAVYPGVNAGGKGTRDEELTVYEGTVTNNHVPMYVFYFDDWTRTQFVIPAEDLADMAGGTINALKFYTTNSNIPYTTVSPFDFYMKEVDYTSISAYETKESCEVVYSGTGDFVVEGTGGAITITFDTPYSYNGGNLLIGCENTSDNGYKNIYFVGQTVNGASISGSNGSSTAAATVNQQNFIPMTTFSYVSGGGSNDDPVTPVVWSNVLARDMSTAVTINVTPNTGTAEGAVLTMVNDNEDITYVVDFDETGSWTIDPFRKGEYTATVTLDGFSSSMNEQHVSIWGETTLSATLTEIKAPVADLLVSNTGFARWTNMMPTDVAESYMVMLNGAFVEETTDNFYQFDQDNLTVGQTYSAKVAVNYTTGISAYTETEFTYLGCESVETQVDTLAGEAQGMNIILVWNGGTPTPPTPTPPVGDVFTFDDGTFQGWTTIDANNDGYDWVLGSQIGGVYLASGASLAGSGHNSSTDLVCSGSYSNATSAAITPDNYLVSPAKAEYTGISFYACAQDASYSAEHYGVAVSTGSAAAADFVMVQEWTMTAKDHGAVSVGRDGQTRAQGSWYEKTVDLSAYAGQDIWVAIRHFNCNDQFILNVDDITLGTPEKATVESAGTAIPTLPARDMWDYLGQFSAAEGGQYGIATDGEYFYTSNWGYSSAVHNFYKYDQDGTVIEGFEISGCGTLRGMAYDGQYFYGVANAATVYCVDLANHTLVSQFTSAYGAMRCITYDPQRDGFWVVGNWSGNLTLIDRTGAVVQVGPAPTSASDVAYYKDANGEEHVYVFCQPSSNCVLYDYNITTNQYSASPILDFSTQTPGCTGSSGGCFVGQYNGMTCFFGNSQQSPNLIGIYELGAGGGSVATSIQPNKFNIFVDGEMAGATSGLSFTYTATDTEEHDFAVFFVDADFNISCPVEITLAAGGVSCDPVTNLTAYQTEYQGAAAIRAEWDAMPDAVKYEIYLDGEVLGQISGTAVTIHNNGTPLPSGTYTIGVVVIYATCESDMAETTVNIVDAVDENEIVSAIYPNPTSGDLSIKAAGMTHVSVFNAMGQMVYDQAVDADELVLNMGQYEAGVYMVRIDTENGSSVKRITVVK